MRAVSKKCKCRSIDDHIFIYAYGAVCFIINTYSVLILLHDCIFAYAAENAIIGTVQGANAMKFQSLHSPSCSPMTDTHGHEQVRAGLGVRAQAQPGVPGAAEVKDLAGVPYAVSITLLTKGMGMGRAIISSLQLLAK